MVTFEVLRRVAEMKELVQYVREVATELVDDLERSAEETDNFGRTSRARPLVSEALEKCLQSLAATDLWGTANRRPSSAVWEVAGDWLERGELQHRAYAKPRGYAGDYVLLTQIHDRYVGNDAVGRCFDGYFQDQDAPEAVRGRMRFAAEALRGHAAAARRPDYHVVSLGCGPGIDLELALREWPATPPRLTLLDLDDEALSAARSRLEPLVGAGQITTCRENLFRLPRLPQRAASLAGADFVICLGLFDYLRARDAADMLGLLWEQLRPGGVLLVGNFAPHCAARRYMEWVAQWYLIYRTADELLELTRAAVIPEECVRIEAEPLGVDLLLRVEKPA